MEFSPGNESPGAGDTATGAHNKSDGTLSNIAARQVSICTCAAGNATGEEREFSQQCKRDIAAKVSTHLANVTRADGPYCKPLPSLKRLRELLDYNPETGILTWRVSRGGQRAGEVCGTDTNGYVQVFIDNVAYRAHRVIFKMVMGRDPIGIIDHKNGNRSDNRLVKDDPEKSNLREVMPWQNSLNRIAPTGSNTGHRGVSWVKSSQRYLASIGIGDRNVKLGLFSCLDCAVSARSYAFNLLVGTPANDNEGVSK